jgi:N5-(cytidine 5'-diphosphoramidyl)-L-glutamine hydrolase
MTNSFQKIVIAVTQRIDKIENRSELRDALDQRMVQWVANNGFLPVTVPNVLVDVSQEVQPMLHDWLKYIKPSAIVLSGGNDIGEYAQRDVTEKYLLSWAQSKKIPVLGVCRGLQLMAVWAGANLVKADGHTGTRHLLVTATKDKKLPTEVNSYHNWGLDTCPNGFDVLAKAQDGAIEAIRHNSLPWEGWMWHPEREAPFNQIDEMRFRALLDIRI